MRVEVRAGPAEELAPPALPEAAGRLVDDVGVDVEGEVLIAGELDGAEQNVDAVVRADFVVPTRDQALELDRASADLGDRAAGPGGYDAVAGMGRVELEVELEGVGELGAQVRGHRGQEVAALVFLLGG